MFAEVMLQTAHHAALLSVDQFLVESFGEPEAFACRYEPGRRLIRTAAGTQEAVEATLYTHRKMAVGDRVWPPGADVLNEGEARVVLLVEQHYDLMTGAADFLTVGI